ncbi:kinase-like domain-containing protein [Podospora australis]|uniref:EKC/KEOPS complex subunit BUD32 n=1 Tax=Podospora australis TaxID=1536484 RepID=A0AAN7AKN7_9PEZI|nr:kinase-like domain-containing protein [Podospora australis]
MWCGWELPLSPEKPPLPCVLLAREQPTGSTASSGTNQISQQARKGKKSKFQKSSGYKFIFWLFDVPSIQELHPAYTTATMATATEPQFPPPKVLTYPASAPPILITQGAEGRLYKTTYQTADRPCALKYRPPKPYRHPILDARLTKARISSEAKVLEKCLREGVPVPAVYGMDPAAGWMAIEWIEGVPVRVGINKWLGERPDEDEEQKPVTAEDDAPLVDLMRRIGSAVGALHKTGVVHGDLTTSNMMLRPWKDTQQNGHAVEGDKAKILEGDVIIIDFGLATQSMSDEDRAVDLYVLERAFASTHPRAERLFEELLGAYGKTFKKGPTVLHKLEDVRMRGRKKSMLG